MCVKHRSDADDALQMAVRILEALENARNAQTIAEAAINKAQGQITDIETSLDNVCSAILFLWAPVFTLD